MATNKTLNQAAVEKDDEFYTRMCDIAAELRHYRKHFKDKTVLCNCDDPYESNFFKYFALNFNRLELKKLIATCYATSPMLYTQLTLFGGEDVVVTEFPANKKPYRIEITEVVDENRDGAIDLVDIETLIKNRKNVLSILEGDGDFRSAECVELLKEADIVCTNPPFSLWIPYFNQLIEYNKKFIIIGNPQAMKYKDVFPLIQQNKVWIGYKPMSEDMLFDVTPEHAEELVRTKRQGSGYKVIDGIVKGRAPAIWYTNLDIEKRHEELDMYKKYNPNEYERYYNYDGIDVGKVSEIPRDYFGAMGVPISFLADAYNPAQFEILGKGNSIDKTMVHTVVGDEIQYIRNGEVVWSTPYTVKERKTGNSLRIEENGKPGRVPFERIIIRRKQ